jgi:hypothetical protein
MGRMNDYPQRIPVEKMNENLKYVPKEVFDWLAEAPEVETRVPNSVIPYLRKKGAKSARICAEWMMREEWDSNSMAVTDPQTLLILKQTVEAQQDVLNEYDFGDAVEMAEKDEDDEVVETQPEGLNLLEDDKDNLPGKMGVRKQISVAFGVHRILSSDSKGDGQIERESRGRKNNKPAWRKRI